MTVPLAWRYSSCSWPCLRWPSPSLKRLGPVYPVSAVSWQLHNSSQTPEHKITSSHCYSPHQTSRCWAFQQTDRPDGVVHQRHHHHYDVVVEVEVWQSYEQITNAPDGHLGKTFITLKRHGLTSLLLLLLPVWNGIRSVRRDSEKGRMRSSRDLPLIVCSRSSR